MTNETTIYKHAIILTTGPYLPIQNGPGWIFLRPESRCGRIAKRYDTVVSKTKEPMNALKAVVDPT